MTHLLPPNLLRLFAARPAIPFAPPLDRNPDRVTDKESQFTGIAHLFAQIQQERDDAETIQLSTAPKAAGEDDMDGVLKQERKRPKLKRQPRPAKPKKIAPTQRAKHKKPKVRGVKPLPRPTAYEAEAAKRGQVVTEQLRIEARAEERQQRKEERVKRNAEEFDPSKDPNATGDPYKTLFVSRLTPDTTEEDLRKEFDMYGRIEKLTLIRDIVSGKSKKYAFIMYEREKDMKAAYKDADGLKIRGKRILVDVERGRTVKGWKPMRLGGGLGGQPKPVVQESFGRFGGAGRGRGAPFRGGFSDRGGGGFRGRGGGAFGAPRGGAFAPRGGGNFDSRGPPGGAFGNGPPQGGAFGQDQGFNGPSGGGAFGQGPPRGQGIGFNQGPPHNAFGMPQGGYGHSGGGGAFGEKRGFDHGPPQSYGGGSNYNDRDSKRPRY